jgi:CheY-like chemotaxis protein
MPSLRLRALVVGEHPGLRRMVRVQLADLPVDVDEASMTEARERVRWELPNVVVFDVGPPVQHVLETCHQLRWNPMTTTIPALLLVESGDAKMRTLATEAGATLCLDKPFHSRQLRQTVGRLLDCSAHKKPNADTTDGGFGSASSNNRDEARLAGVRLAARTAHHLLNIPLSLALGYGELLAVDPRLPADLRPMAEQVVVGIDTAARLLERLVKVRRLVELDATLWGGPVLDITAAVAES